MVWCGVTWLVRCEVEEIGVEWSGVVCLVWLVWHGVVWCGMV